jgi:predicted TIM-barrel fold metal-dependent hydrolase
MIRSMQLTKNLTARKSIFQGYPAAHQMKSISQNSAPLIDAHAHVFRRDLPFVPNSAPRFSRDFTVEDYIAVLDSAGVRFGAIAAASFLGTYSDYTLMALQKYSRLRATVIVEPGVSMSRLREFDRAGVVGIRMAVANFQDPPDLRSAEYRQLLSRIADLDWHVHVYGKREQLISLIPVLSQIGVKLVVDHFGARDNESGPSSEIFQTVLRSVEKGRTWVKISGPYLSEQLDHQSMVSALIAAGDSQCLLWASDWPFVKLNGDLEYSRTIEWLQTWIPDPAVRQQIDRNAATLYRFNLD